MAETITGKLEAIAKNGSGIKVGDKWYNMTKPDAQNKDGAERGDTIAFQWEVRKVNGKPSNTITTVIKVKEKGQSGGGKGNYSGKGKGGYNKGGYNNDPEKQASIIRQSCMGYAATIVSQFEFSSPEEAAAKVVEIADTVFRPYAAEGSVEVAPKKSSGKKPAPKQEESFEEPEEEFGSDSSEEFEDDFPF